MKEDKVQYGFAGNEQEIIAQLENLKARAEAGETIRAAFRLYLADGTYEDVVLAPTKEEEDQLRADLNDAYRKAH